MVKKVSPLIVLTAFALTLALGIAATPAFAKHGNRAGRLEGKVTALDTGAQTVTIQERKGQVVTLQVNATTKIERNERHVSLVDLMVGDRAEARFDPGTLIASKIESEGP